MPNGVPPDRVPPDGVPPDRVPPDRAAAAGALPDRLAFLGLGLIGGSIVMALRESGYGGRIAAWTPRAAGPTKALRRGLIDEAATSAASALDGAGLVVLAGPPLAVLEAIDDLAGPLRGALASNATVTDVASTKRRIVERAAAIGLRFVGGHPMAGRESTGVDAASADLFEGRPWVVVDGNEEAPNLRLVLDLARASGAEPVTMPAEEHDAAVAAISHLPLVLSAALVESVAGGALPGWHAGRSLVAGGWRDMTRLANGDPEMGAGILATNAGPVRAQLGELRATIDRWIEALETEAPDVDGLRTRLGAARDALAQEHAT